MSVILITGAAGRIATALRPRLLAHGHDLVLLDGAEPAPSSDTTRERVFDGSINDPDVLDDALAGVDTVVHLAGIPTEDTWEHLLETNITGTKNVLEAAARAGVRRVLLASSIHAVGRVVEDDGVAVVPGDRVARPDTYYGVTKAAMELLGSLFADRAGMAVVSARIGAFGERPPSRRALRMWSSADDLTRLVEATAALDTAGHHVVWAVSRNTDSPADLSAGERIGYHPEDDAARVLTPAEAAALPPEEMDYLGGGMAGLTLGRSPSS